MMQRILQRIRNKVRCRQYDMTAHAMEEMAEDNLDIIDIEHVILGGQIIRVEKDSERGTKYVIYGTAIDPNIAVEVVVRITANSRLLIITVYEITD